MKIREPALKYNDPDFTIESINLIISLKDVYSDIDI